MKRIHKIILGVLSFVPLVFLIAFFVYLVPAFFMQNRGGFRARFDLMFIGGILTSVLLLALLVAYTVILAQRPDLHIGEKVGVPILIFFTNGVLLPLIWWFYIWRGSSLVHLSASR